MNAEEFIDQTSHAKYFSDQMVHVQELPPRDACYQDVQGGMHPAVESVLAKQGITQLYSHQATAIDLVRQDKSIVIVTGTASGKTLCYTIPVMEALLEDDKATMLFLYPTKALAQDQLRGLGLFQDPDAGIKFMACTYDVYTPQNLRRKFRDG